MARQFQEVWNALNIQYDTFVQTSSERHKACCRKFIQKVYDNGHIYLGNYEGWYCVADEAFYTEKDLVDGMSPTGRKSTPSCRRWPIWRTRRAHC